MGTELTTTANRAVAPARTPEGASALRQIASSAAWRADAGDVRNWLGPAVRDALPLALQEARAMLAPALGRDFKRLVAPTLSLVAPAGMSEQDAAAWLATAADTLRGMPADLLEVGCRAAREKADHPSKIMPAIMGTVKRIWDARRADLARLDLIDRVARGERVRRPWEPETFDEASRCSPEQTAAIAAEYGFASPEQVVREAKPMPTVEDYMRETNISREAAQKLVDRQRAQMVGKQIGEARAA